MDATHILIVTAHLGISLLFYYFYYRLHSKGIRVVFLVAFIVFLMAGTERLFSILNNAYSPVFIAAILIISAALLTLYTIYRCKLANTQFSRQKYPFNVTKPKNQGQSLSSAPHSILSSPGDLLFNTLPVWLVKCHEEGFVSCWQSAPLQHLLKNKPGCYWINPADQTLVFEAELHHGLSQFALGNENEACFSCMEKGRVKVRRVQNNHLLLEFQSVDNDKVKSTPVLQHESLKQAFNASIAGVFVFDAVSQRPYFINDRFEQITGHEQQSTLQKGPVALLRLVHKEDQKRVIRHFRHLFLYTGSNAISSPVQFRFLHAKGKWVWLMGQYSVLSFTRDQNVHRLMGSYLDITVLHRLQDNLVKAKEDAEQANKTKTEFLANMSHEIRTPMNAVLALTDMLLKMELGNTQREYLSKVQLSSQSLLNILNDILDYSKLEAGKLRICAENVDLFTLLSEVLHLFSVSAADKNLQLCCKLHPECPRWIVSDGMRIKQILSNLVGNAIKFTDTGMVCLHVKLDVTERGDSLLQFKISDTGTGMDKDQLSLLFGAFSQADNSICRRYGGSGLGLSISKKLAGLLDGGLTGTSAIGEGSCFCFSLPLLLPASPVPPSLNTNMSVGVVTPHQGASPIYHYCQMLQVDVIFEHDLAQLFSQNIPDCDILVVDLGGADYTQQHAIMTHMLSKNPATGIATRVVFIGCDKYAQSAATDIILNQPSVWVFPPFLPSDLETAFNSLVSKTGAGTGQSGRDKVRFPNCAALVVEDNAMNQYVANQLLTAIGFTVTLASSGEQALQLVEQQAFDVIFMDLQMPGMDGYSTTLAMKKRPALKNTPIIAISAAVLEQDKQRVINVGMDAHIPKPIDRNMLLDTLLTCLKPKAVFDNQLASDAPQTYHDNKVVHKQFRQLLPGFDISSVFRRLGNDAEQYRQLLTNFNLQYSGAEDFAINAESSDKQQRQLHSLKSMAATIGANRLSVLAAEGEKNLADGHLVTVRVITDELALVIKTIRHCLTHLNTQKSPPLLSGATNLDDLQSRLEKRGYMRHSDIERYRESLEEKFGQQTAQQICLAMARLDYSQAIDLLTQTENTS